MNAIPKTEPDEKRCDSVTGKRKKIGLLTLADARDRSVWSGTVYFMSEALQRNCGDVVYLGPLGTPWAAVGKLINRVTLRLLGKQYDYKRSKWYAGRMSAIVHKRLAVQHLDFIVAPAAASAIARLKHFNTPIFFVSDTTFALVNNYYADFSNYLPISVSDGNWLAKSTMERANIVSFPSQWAVDSAIRDYGIAPDKVHVIPFGANMDDIPSSELAMNRPRSGECRLLFLGVDWVRKGGDIAFETLLSLEKNHGIKAQLTVCGCQVPEGVKHERLTEVGFLDKRDPHQAEQLAQLFRDADYLLLPTRNECYGVVFCEASAYGVPSISTDTGGVSGVIEEGENGMLLPEDARGDEYANVIAATETDHEKYRELCLSSRHEYDTRLNWDVWAKQVELLLDELQSKPV